MVSKDNSKVVEVTHTYPEEEKVNKKKLLFGVLIFLSLCVFIIAIMVKGKEVAIEKESNKGQETIEEQGDVDEKEQVEETVNITGSNEVLEENNTTEEKIEESFVAPEGTNVLLEELSIDQIKDAIIKTTKEYKANPSDKKIKYQLLVDRTNKKLVDYFEKRNPDEEVIELYIGDEMAYYTIKTKSGYYYIDMFQDIGQGGKTSTKLTISKIKGVDMETFELYNRYSKDKNYVYRDYNILSGADTKTFISYDRNYAKDKNNVYCFGDIMEGVDYDTFEVLNEDYAKDKNHIYTYTDIMEGVDYDTFEAINDFFAKDKNHVYMYGSIAEGLDPDTFDPDNIQF